MNKKELVENISVELKISTEAAKKFLDWTVKVISNIISRWQEVYILWLGKFHIVKKSWKKIANPITKEPMYIESYYAPVFRPCKAIKTAVKNKFKS